MISLQHAQERGHSDLGWLKSAHSFSFSDYYDPQHMGFETLRVINDDIVSPGAGFNTHPHKNMEIISYVLEGALAHRDSMDNGSVIRAGDVQRMSAGTGVTHSEYNHSQTESVHFLQIWFYPKEKDLSPSYEQKTFSAEEKTNRLALIASESGRDGSLSINQDVDIYAALLTDPRQTLLYQLQLNRKAWLHVARGSLLINDTHVTAGDGLAFDTGEMLLFEKGKNAEFLLFDMAPVG